MRVIGTVAAIMRGGDIVGWVVAESDDELGVHILNYNYRF